MGQHSLPSRHPGIQALLALLGVAALLGVYLTVIAGDRPAAGCSGPEIPLAVGADPAAVPWLGELAAAYGEEGRRVLGRCAAVSVRAVDADAAGTAKVDVWVAESGTAVGLARTRPRSPEAQRALAVPATSIASSPVVLGVPVEAAARLRAGGREPSFADLIGMARDPAGWGPDWGAVRFSTLDPAGTAVGAGFVVAAVGALTGRRAEDVGAATFGQVNVQNSLLGLVRTLVAAPPTSRELLDRTAAATDTASLLREVGVLALPERDLWRYDGAVPLQALYPLGGQLAADFPYAVLDAPWVDADARAVAADFRDWLRSGPVQDRLGGFGLRRADGTAGPELAGHGLTAAQVKPDPPVAAAGPAAARSAWELITRPVSTLTVVDVSGSMAERVPGSKSKIQLAKEAGTAALEFVDDDDSIGLWEFSADMVGKRDFRPLVALGPAGTKAGRHADRRLAVASAYRGMRPRTGTGLYDTVLAAYRAALDGYRPDAVNTVLVLTDGRNEDPGSIDLAGTLARLKAWYRPSRPVHLVTLAYGAAADRTVLTQLARATHGMAFSAVDPRQLASVFVQAVTVLPTAHA